MRELVICRFYSESDTVAENISTSIEFLSKGCSYRKGCHNEEVWVQRVINLSKGGMLQLKAAQNSQPTSEFDGRISVYASLACPQGPAPTILA